MWLVPFGCRFAQVQLAQWASFSNSIARTRTTTLLSYFYDKLHIHKLDSPKYCCTKKDLPICHDFFLWRGSAARVPPFFFLESYGQAVSRLWRDCNTWEKSKGGGRSSRDAREGWTLNKAAVNVDLWSWRLFLFVLPVVLCGIWPHYAGHKSLAKIKEI